jgi:hypothetical protein
MIGSAGILPALWAGRPRSSFVVLRQEDRHSDQGEDNNRQRVPN